MKALWPSPSHHMSVGKFKKLLNEFPQIDDDWIIEVDHQGFHIQHPDEARTEFEPILDPTTRCECQCHRGKQADHEWNSKKPICPHCGKRAPI